MVQMPSMICVSEQYKRFKLQICFFKSDSIFNILLEISSFQKQEHIWNIMKTPNKYSRDQAV